MLGFAINTVLLRDVMASLHPLVPKKPSRDVLKCVKIIAKSGIGGEPDTVSFLVTDLETFGVQVLDDVVVSNSGECVVPAQTFFDYVKSLDNQRVNVNTSKNEKLILDADGTEFEVGLQEIDEFPDFPKLPKDDNRIQISLSDMASALKKTVFAVAEKGSPRWGSLSSVCLELNENKLSLIGTDQARASIVDLEINSNLKNKQFLVSAKSLDLLSKVFSESFELSTVDKNSLIFINNKTSLFFRLTHGTFPPVKNFIPKKYPNSLEILPVDLLKQAKKVSLAADEHSSVKLILKKDEITLSAKTRKQRKVAKVKLDVDYNGPDFEFSLDCRFLLDILKALDGQTTVKLEFNQNNQPILFTQNNFRHICVPLETR